MILSHGDLWRISLVRSNDEGFHATATSNPRHQVAQQWNAATGETQYPSYTDLVCILFCGQHRNKQQEWPWRWKTWSGLALQHSCLPSMACLHRRLSTQHGGANNYGNVNEQLLKLEGDILMAGREGGECKRLQTRFLPSDDLKHLRLQRREAENRGIKKELSFQIVRLQRRELRKLSWVEPVRPQAARFGHKLNETTSTLNMYSTADANAWE